MRGKPENKSIVNKWLRNQLKLNQARQECNAYSQSLMNDLLSVWNSRHDIIRPATQAFLECEKLFSEMCVHSACELIGFVLSDMPLCVCIRHMYSFLRYLTCI